MVCNLFGIWYHMPMETSESQEWARRPEFDHDYPAKIFEYAKLKLAWIHDRVNQAQWPEAVDHLAEELEYHVTDAFDRLPDITVTAEDVMYTKRIDIQADKIFVQVAPVPLEGDAALYGEHTIQGRLFGFYCDPDGELRVYVSIGDLPRQLPGGIYTPLLSVSLEDAEIRLSEVSVAEKRDELKTYIAEQSHGYSQETRTLITVLYDIVDQKQCGVILSLQSCSPLIADIARQKEVSPQTVDALLELVNLSLDLGGMHTIQASSYREVITVRPIPSYKAQAGPVEFTNVSPELGLIGETASRGLGLFFIHNDSAVQIPVQYITKMFKN